MVPFNDKAHLLAVTEHRAPPQVSQDAPQSSFQLAAPQVPFLRTLTRLPLTQPFPALPQAPTSSVYLRRTFSVMTTKRTVP